MNNSRNLSLFDNIHTGQQLAEIGAEMALDHADEVQPNWSEAAYRLIQDFTKMYGSVPFQAEQVRSYAAQIDFPLPPHARAWGALFSKASKEGVIKSIGYAKVKNPKAHAATAALWIRA